MADQKNKIFIGGVSWATDEKKFGEYFGAYGEIKDCVIMRNPATGNPRGFGFITFMDPSSIDKLFEQGEHVIDGKKLDIKVAIPREEMTRNDSDLPPLEPKPRRTCKIFVGGTSLETTGADLEEHFGKYGIITEATVMMDRESGRSRGFAFVVFESEDSVEQLLQDTHEIRGKKVDCKKAVPREDAAAELPKPKNPRTLGGGFAFPFVGNRVDERRLAASFDEKVRRAVPDDRRYVDVRKNPPVFDRYQEKEFEFPVPKQAPSTPYFPSPYPTSFPPTPYSPFLPSPAPTFESLTSPNYAIPPTTTPSAWDYAAAAAYANAAASYAANIYGDAQALNAAYAQQPAGYGAIRSTTSATPKDRYRPY